VVYLESGEDLEMTDVDISDVLLAIARRISQSLYNIQIGKPNRLKSLLQGATEFLNSEVTALNIKVPTIGDIGITSQRETDTLDFGIAQITAKVKSDTTLREKVNQYFGPQKTELLEAINKELLEPAITSLKQQGKKGLVVIVDNLDRLDSRQKSWGRPQQEYLFVDQSEYLTRLNCHLIYTMPLGLKFSNDYGNLVQRFEEPRVLPMVPVQLQDGSEHGQGMALLRQMVLARAFPDLDEQQRLNNITEIFDSAESLDRLCGVSGGHVRDLLRLLNTWIMEEMALPLSRQTLEAVIRARRNEMMMPISDDEWELLRQVWQRKKVSADQEYLTLIRSRLVFEYRDRGKSWFDINPILAEAIEAKKEQELLDKALAKAQQFLRQAGAATSRDKRALQVTSIPGRLKSYAPLPVMFAAQPVDRDVTELVQNAAQLGGNHQQQAGMLFYQEPPDALFRMRMAEVRLRDHFVLIPIPCAAMEQALTDEAASTGLLAQYASRYLPGADLFDDRNAIGDTLSFFGRGNLLHSLEEDLRRTQGIGLFGLRKSGKTSLLLQLGFAMRQHPVVHIDLQPYGGKLRYGAELFNQILQELSKLVKKRTSSLVQNPNLFESDRPAIDLTTVFAGQFGDLAKLLGEAKYQLPILLFLDEIERILPTEVDSRERAEEFNAFFGVLRALSQEQRLLSLLIADVHADANRINHWTQASVPTNPVFSFFKEVFVSPFSQEETTEMLTEIGKLMGVEFDKETLAGIHQYSGGHPFIARQLASLLCKKVDKEKSDKGELIKLSAATRYLNKPFKHSGILKDYFEQNIWADLQKRNFASAMAVLRLLACNEESAEGITEETLLDRLSHDFSESECTDALLWLEAVGLVLREELEDDDSYRIQILLMSRWLRMQMKPEEIHQWQLK
jgi:hypothetical protein